MAAITKVVLMLEDLQGKVLKEGEEEVKTYNKFACFCKDTIKDKGEAITDGENSQSTLQAKIEADTETRTGIDSAIEGLTDDLKQLDKDVDKLKTDRKKEVKEYKANEADLIGAVEALEGAIQSLKSAKSPSLVQWQQVAKTVRLATVMADALGFGGKAFQNSGAAFLLQENGDVPTEAYSFKSDSIIETLEGLLKDFKAKRNKVDEAEVTASHNYDMSLQDLTDQIDTKNREMDTKKKELAKKMADIATASQDLSVVSAVMLDDKAYLTELSKMCSNKAKTWDVRSSTRADEIGAITTAIGIVKDEVASKTSGKTVRFAQRSVRVWPAQIERSFGMEAVETSAEEAAEAVEANEAPTFLQRGLRGRHDDDGRKTVIDLLRSEGMHLHSTMLTSLATQVAEDPLAKVKTLIQELVERLLAQAANEANQKGWCDKSMSAAKQKRDFAAEEIRELNGNMAELDALRDKLAEEIKVLTKEVEDLEKEQEDADTERGAEKKENGATVTEAKAGQEAVEMAITVLDRFYKTAAKQKVDLELVQRGPAADEAPDAGFDEGEAYGGAQGGSEGVLGLLDVIRSDFARTKKETEKAEKQAEQDHLEFSTKTGSSIAEKGVAKDEKTTQKDDADTKFTEAEDGLKSQTDLLKGAIEELKQLHDTCVDTAMSYEERVSRREEEMASLKKAECILTSYAQYGPDAAASSGC